jgi:hypothetical protein
MTLETKLLIKALIRTFKQGIALLEKLITEDKLKKL